MACFEFVDFTRAEEYEISKLYRKINSGINIFGICKFEKCLVFDKEIIVPLKGIKSFNFKKKLWSLSCPICDHVIKPLTFGFYLCKYKIEGKIIENSQIKSISIKDKSDNNEMIKFYDPKNNKRNLFLELNITVS